MKRVFLGLILADILLIAYSLLVGKGAWLINSQIAFIASSLVVLASMLSYQNMVRGRLALDMVPEDNRDTLDKLEDPYDLYDEEQKSSNEEKTLVEIVKEERKKLKKSKRSFWEATKDSKASLSFYRLGAYALLVLGFFYLNSNQLLEITPFLIALGIPPVVIVIMLFQAKDEK